MVDIASGSTVELLQYLHESLDEHFTGLHAARAALPRSSPVFALEHGLSADDLNLLQTTVRTAVRDGLGARHRLWWLPFVVYAAESGYDYVGDEYWRTFEQATPGWRDDQRSWIKTWFQKFAGEYGGAVPTGAFAGFFKIIAWPITHAVLPTYLQRQLAQLLYEFSGALTSDLLDDPDALGSRLARRASSYTERFRVFCENTTLVGQVASALLSGENEPTPYLLASTLDRIVDGLSEEQQARHWLKSARQSASRVRGFRSEGGARTTERRQSQALPRATDPRLFLRLDRSWQAYAELPDLTTLGAGLPDVYNQLRTSRATVNGGERHVPPSGLLYASQEVKLASWPQPDGPFLHLDRGDDKANALLANQCAITKGPWWLFRRQGAGLAIEIKSKFIRPGHVYILVGTESVVPPAVPWCAEVVIGAQHARAYELSVPDQLSENDEAALRGAGITVISHVEIRPVGVTASAWDGEGEVEWLAGQPATFGIRSDLQPDRCRIILDEAVYLLDWAKGDMDLLFSLEGVGVGTHELSAALLGEADRQLASGSVIITIRDPQVRPEGASAGEGIRLLAAPARPTLSEIWDGRADVTVDGPLGAAAELHAELRDSRDQAVAEACRSIHLPLDEDGWKSTLRSIRNDPHFSDAYDESESCLITVRHDGVGFVTLTCERGFQPLRWRFGRSHDGHVVATLVDRTDGGGTTVEFYDVEAPLIATLRPPDEPVDVPSRGGLVIARAEGASAAAVLPTNPNAVLHMAPPKPAITSQNRSAQEVLRLIQGHHRWVSADLPADPFAVYEQQIVGDAIARAIGTLIGGSYWARLEKKLATVPDAAEFLDDMQDAVGNSREHKALASTIAYNLYKWLKPEDLLRGFPDVIIPKLAGYGITNKMATPRFLLMLAGRPGFIGDWEPDEATILLDRVLVSPILYRAARFAVLGTRALNDAEGVERGF